MNKERLAAGLQPDTHFERLLRASDAVKAVSARLGGTT